VLLWQYFDSIKGYMAYKRFLPQQIRILLSLSVILIVGRIVLFGTSSLDYLFWNLFLACLPFVISAVLLFYNRRKKLSPVVFTSGVVIWLLLLPNAPYIITDLIHIGYGHTSTVLYTIVLIFTCAFTGLALGMHSLSHMDQVFKSHFSYRTASVFLIASMFLASVGICFGRFMRFNSWDIVIHSGNFLQIIGGIFMHPELYTYVYIMTGTFFLFIFMVYSAWNFNVESAPSGQTRDLI
jgi:uncharacterized membrane protein